ncbi:zinc finger protein 37 homolog [Cheilinus undulatus]|uniref:zinc finger protein 37 homolog n=1 Tax=Cheilinus undulatus TaxID=241271 RepID=UPI001BD30023|nr:zinc finger protein 37 homolog [Cheilinus undulatus]
MFSVERFRDVNETAAAEEICDDATRAAVECKAEIDRHHRELDTVWNPDIHLLRLDAPQQNVCKEEETVAEQELCHQERKSSLAQEEPEPPQIKEEQEGEQFIKDETDTWMLTPTKEESEHTEADGQHELQLLCHNSHVAENQDPTERKQTDAEITGKSKPRQEKGRHTDAPQQHVCKEEEIVAEQELCHQERKSSLAQEEPEPPQIKEQQEREQFIKEETDTWMLTPTKEESEHREADGQHELQLLCHNSHVAENRDPTEKKQKDSEITRKSKPRQERDRNHTGESRHSCYTCGEGFLSTSHLKSHMKTHTGEKPFSCTSCGKRFRRESYLNDHILTHTGTKPYTCDTCGTSFTKKCTLDSHLKIHTGEKSYTCTMCNKSFRRKGHLTVHMRLHTGEKPFSCSTCGKRYRCKSNLNIHILTHTGTKLYTCGTCGKSFTKKCNLDSHLNIHTSEKPHTCTMCNKSFRRKGTLTDHMRTHTDEKPFSCSTCGKRFRHKSNLNHHILTHRGTKPYTCGTCGKSFTKKRTLYTHCKIHTDNNA